MFQVSALFLTMLSFSDVLLEKVCTTEARPGVVVELFDAESNQPLQFSSEDRVEIREGEYREALEVTRLGDGGSFASGAMERSGIYKLVVEKRGFDRFILGGIEVPEDDCGHVITSRQRVRLRRDET